MTENPENIVILNKEPCGTLNDDGCLQIFPYFDGPSGSLCMKCKKLQNAETEEQRTRIRESCEGCGLCSSQLAEPFCGRCKRRDREAKGLPDPHADAAAARLNIIHRRIGNPNPPSGTARGPLQLMTNNLVGPTTSAAELEAIRTAKAGGHFTVHVFYTTKGVVNKNIGNHSFNLPMDMHLDEVLSRAVAHADLEWTQDSSHPLSLKVEDCSLRFKGNMSIEPDTLSGTLRDLYNYYIGRPDKIHVTANNRLGLAKGTYLAFECSINVQRYDRRVLELKARYAAEDDSGSLLSSKRRSNDSSSSGEPTKRRRGTGTLSSNVRFANNLGALGYGAPPLAPAKCVEVTFKHFVATVTEEEADMSEISTEQEGRIEVNPLILSISDRGKSKNVYKFYIKDKIFAAKRFFDTGNKPNADGTVVVSKRDNDVGLARDLYRLVRMQMFRSKYMERAATVNFGEISNFQVSSGFLITIQSALPMLDTGASTTDAALVDNSTYLMEPFRSSSVVRKFSGTLGVTADHDKLAMTIMSFSHFVMEYTACTMAIADLQGSLHTEPGEARAMYLFDPMTHTLTQDSGVGDFGSAGIQDAIENHDCNIFCKGLNLIPKTVLEETFARQKADHGNAVAT
ncbi:kinase-like domain-containing protein [Mycena galericulata]|nr:kinase-like domain-containing protein [Mycena galericulata]